MEGMEDLPKETCEDKFREAVGDFQRAGVRPEESKDEDNSDNDDNKTEEGEE